jgi:uncharacterized LabA/DUF88 family protein
LDRNGYPKDYILKTLSFPILHDIIQERMKSVGLWSHPFIHTDFVCSDRGQIGKAFASHIDRMTLLKKLRNEMGVTVREVVQTTKSQKGVDFEVFTWMMTLTNTRIQPHHIVLFASDADYIPAIRLLTEQGAHVVVVGFKNGANPLNEGLINESYLSLDLKELLNEMGKRQRPNKKPK